MSGGFAPVDVALSLQKIEPSKLDDFVEGGHKVSIWAEVYPDGVRLIDPIFLSKAKCHNVAKLPDQQERNDARHLRILMTILPAHFETLLELALQHDPATSDRKLLNEVKLL